MRLDTRQFTAGTTLETEVCIIGAGPAGLVLAAALIAHGCDVLVLESGGDAAEPTAAALNDGDCSGDPYAGLQATRHRGIGGATGIWNTSVQGRQGAKLAPLDPIDFEFRARDPLSGWPLTWEELAPYYRRAWHLCDLGDPTGEDNPRPCAGPAPIEFEGPHLASALYRFVTRDALIDPKITAIEQAANVRLCSHATVLRLERTGPRVMGASVATVGGPAWRVHARWFVLAAGAVENARLLLASGDAAGGLGNESGWVGRCFMEHPRDRSLTLTPVSPGFFADAAFYDVHSGLEGGPVVGRIALRPDGVRAGRLPNASGTLLPRVRRLIPRIRSTVQRLTRWEGVDRLFPVGGHGWSHHPAPILVYRDFTVLLNIEQRPHPENRIVLGRRRDALGVPVPELRWRWRSEDQERLERLRATVATELEGAGLGRVTIDAGMRIDPNAHHHAGTTRMHADPRFGVVDTAGRVHTTDNLFIAGASVFPTVGFANPVLSIVALSARLADHLAAIV